MKLASKFNLFAMGLAVATAAQSISAMPVIRMVGPDSGVNPNSLMPAWQSGGNFEPFQAVLTSPTAAGMNDAATLAYQMADLNALQALSLGGFGGVGSMTACEMDVLEGVSLALTPSMDTNTAKLLGAEAAQDMIATLTGLPLLGLDSLAINGDTLVAPAITADINALVASILGNDGVDADEATTELAEAIEASEPNLMGSQGAGGGGGGGGAFYGGANAGLGRVGPVYGSSQSQHHGHHQNSGGGSGGNSGGVTPNIVVPTIISTDGDAFSGASGGSTVPLPTGAWAGLFLLGTLGGAYKLRTNREVIA